MISSSHWKEICQKLIYNLNFDPQDSPKKVLSSSVFLDEKIELKELLAQLKTDSLFYFESKKLNREFLAINKLKYVRTTHEKKDDAYEKVNAIKTKYFGNIYTTLSFNSTKDESTNIWQDCSEVEFFIPQLEFICHANKIQVNLNVYNDSSVTNSVKVNLHNVFSFCDKKPVSVSFPKLISESSNPSKKEWIYYIKTALQKIHSKVFDKVVLARKIALTFESPVDTVKLFEKMNQQEPDCSLILYRNNTAKTFISVSPESLFYKKNDDIFADVLAGTTSVGENNLKTEQLAKALQKSNKDIKEHNNVLTYIYQKLSKFSKSVNVLDKMSVLSLSKVQHLKTTLNIKVSKSFSDLDILKQLHPTPAVGGTPKKESLEFIQEVEPFNRGLFTGALGIMGTDFSDIIVGIRCCVIDDNMVHLYVGSGIVDSSNAESEWAELDKKVQNYMTVLTK